MQIIFVKNPQKTRKKAWRVRGGGWFEAQNVHNSVCFSAMVWNGNTRYCGGEIYLEEMSFSIKAMDLQGLGHHECNRGQASVASNEDNDHK